MVTTHWYRARSGNRMYAIEFDLEGMFWIINKIEFLEGKVSFQKIDMQYDSLLLAQEACDRMEAETVKSSG